LSSQGILKNLARITIKTLEDPKVEMGGVATVLNRAIGLLRDNGHNQFSAEHHPIVFVLIHKLNQMVEFPIPSEIEERYGYELADVVNLANHNLPIDSCPCCGENVDDPSQFRGFQRKHHSVSANYWECETSGWSNTR